MGEAGMSDLREFLPCHLREFTGDFSEENFLGKTQFGKLYRGMIANGANLGKAHPVTVKIWDDSVCGFANPEDKRSKLIDEVRLLQRASVNGHQQNLAKPIGYSREYECLGIVYDLNPRDTLYNLILKDNFTWLQRIKVALQLARLLVFFNSCCPPFTVSNICAAHIMVDKVCMRCPPLPNASSRTVLLNFGMPEGSLFGNARDIPDGQAHGAPGRMDFHFLTVGGWSKTDDVFSYGILLLSLIAKNVSDYSNPETSVVFWAKDGCKKKMSWSLIERNVKHVHQIFKQDPDYDAYRITRLAMHCVKFSPKNRPRMSQELRLDGV